MRPSHDTRERTLARLRGGYVAGRLDTETFSRRIDCALAAADGGELHGLTADLPGPRRRPRLPAGLRALLASGRGTTARLPAIESLTAGALLLGRSSACHLVFADDTVSRRHAELKVLDGRWMLRDLGSANGTWVNGRRVVEAEVTPGDVVHLGHCRFRL